MSKEIYTADMIISRDITGNEKRYTVLELLNDVPFSGTLFNTHEEAYFYLVKLNKVNDLLNDV